MKSPIASIILALLLPVGVFAENTYLSSGVAASDRAWTGSDYTNFFALLKDDKIPLPRLADEQGNTVMMRICSIDNLAFPKNKNLPLPIRMGDYLSIQESIAGLFNIYLKKAAEGEKVGGEVSLLFGFLLQCSAVGIEVVEEFVPTITKDAQYEVRMDGLRQMKSGLTTTFIGAYRSIAEDTLYTDAERSHIIEQLALTAESFARILPEDTRTEMIAKFIMLSKRFEGSRDKQSLQSIAEKLRG